MRRPQGSRRIPRGIRHPVPDPSRHRLRACRGARRHDHTRGGARRSGPYHPLLRSDQRPLQDPRRDDARRCRAGTRQCDPGSSCRPRNPYAADQGRRLSARSAGAAGGDDKRLGHEQAHADVLQGRPPLPAHPVPEVPQSRPGRPLQPAQLRRRRRVGRTRPRGDRRPTDAAGADRQRP